MLRAEGHNVIGLTMQLWNQRRLAGREGMPEAVHGRCCSLDDVYDARRVAQQIGIPYYVVNHEERFEPITARIKRTSSSASRRSSSAARCSR